jgi:hypothetical protein
MKRIRRLVRDERGFTLADLMTTYRSVGYSSRQTGSLDQARTALAQLDHEVRVAAEIADATDECPSSTCLQMAVPQPGGTIIDVKYSFDSDAHTVYRRTGSAALGTWSSPVPVAINVRNTSDPVFCRAPSSCTTPSEKSIAVTLDVNVDAAKTRETIRLATYATPRNQ